LVSNFALLLFPGIDVSHSAAKLLGIIYKLLHDHMYQQKHSHIFTMVLIFFHQLSYAYIDCSLNVLQVSFTVAHLICNHMPWWFLKVAMIKWVHVKLRHLWRRKTRSSSWNYMLNAEKSLIRWWLHFHLHSLGSRISSLSTVLKYYAYQF